MNNFEDLIKELPSDEGELIADEREDNKFSDPIIGNIEIESEEEEIKPDPEGEIIDEVGPQDDGIIEDIPNIDFDRKEVVIGLIETLSSTLAASFSGIKNDNPDKYLMSVKVRRSLETSYEKCREQLDSKFSKVNPIWLFVMYVLYYEIRVLNKAGINPLSRISNKINISGNSVKNGEKIKGSLKEGIKGLRKKKFKL